MAKYRVRSGFCAHLDTSKYPSGTELDLTHAQFELVKHQVEPIEKKPTTKKDGE